MLKKKLLDYDNNYCTEIPCERLQNTDFNEIEELKELFELKEKQDKYISDIKEKCFGENSKK